MRWRAVILSPEGVLVPSGQIRCRPRSREGHGIVRGSLSDPAVSGREGGRGLGCQGDEMDVEQGQGAARTLGRVVLRIPPAHLSEFRPEPNKPVAGLSAVACQRRSSVASLALLPRAARTTAGIGSLSSTPIFRRVDLARKGRLSGDFFRWRKHPRRRCPRAAEPRRRHGEGHQPMVEGPAATLRLYRSD